jgi:ribokinase
MITVFGSINVDLVTRVERAPRPGETVRGSDYKLIPGGKGANQALAAKRSGATVFLVGAVGDDFLAGVALTELKAAGVGLGSVAHVKGPSGVAIITVDENGENTIVVGPGANATLRAAALSQSSFSSADTLLLQMEVPFAENLAAAAMAHAAGARVILSLAPYAPLGESEVAAFDILVVNQHEAADLARHLALEAGDAEATVKGLAARLARTVIATHGPEGAVAAGPEGAFRVPALPVKAVDTTGAGDTFCGVLAARLDRGESLSSAMRFAAVAGSLAVTREGAQPSFPTLAEIEAASRQTT